MVMEDLLTLLLSVFVGWLAGTAATTFHWPFRVFFGVVLASKLYYWAIADPPLYRGLLFGLGWIIGEYQIAFPDYRLDGFRFRFAQAKAKLQEIRWRYSKARQKRAAFQQEKNQYQQERAEFFRQQQEEDARKQEEERQRQEREQKEQSESASKQKSFDPYEVLGVKRGCSYEEAKKAYLKKMKEYHPDKVDHLGEELKELALKKAKEITKAWEQLQKDC